MIKRHQVHLALGLIFLIFALLSTTAHLYLTVEIFFSFVLFSFQFILPSYENQSRKKIKKGPPNKNIL